MGISEPEVRAQRIITAYFIKADSLEVTLFRVERTSDGAGGYTTGSPAPLPPQVMRLVPLQDGASAAGPANRFTADGQAVRPSYMLIGKHDADMERFDTFTLNTGRYEVVFVNANRQYEVKGEVAYLGQ